MKTFAKFTWLIFWILLVLPAYSQEIKDSKQDTFDDARTVFKCHMDGIRPDVLDKMLQKSLLPHFKMLIERGVMAKNFSTIFPSETYAVMLSTWSGLNSGKTGISGWWEAIRTKEGIKHSDYAFSRMKEYNNALPDKSSMAEFMTAKGCHGTWSAFSIFTRGVPFENHNHRYVESGFHLMVDHKYHALVKNIKDDIIRMYKIGFQDSSRYPTLMSTIWGSADEFAHKDGLLSDKANRQRIMIDGKYLNQDYIDAILNFDSHLGEIITLLKSAYLERTGDGGFKVHYTPSKSGITVFDKTLFILFSDHGFDDTPKKVNPRAIFVYAGLNAVPSSKLPTIPSPATSEKIKKYSKMAVGGGKRKARYLSLARAEENKIKNYQKTMDSIQVIHGGGASAQGQFHVRHPEKGWKERPDLSHLQNYPIVDKQGTVITRVDLIEFLLKYEGVELVFARGKDSGKNKRVHIFGKQGEGVITVWQKEDGQNFFKYDIIRGKDPFGYKENPEAGQLVGSGFYDALTWRKSTVSLEIADAVAEVGQFMGGESKTRGDLVATTADGYSFNTNNGSHGGIRGEQMRAFMIISGKAIDPKKDYEYGKILDIAPTTLAYLGYNTSELEKWSGNKLDGKVPHNIFKPGSIKYDEKGFNPRLLGYESKYSKNLLPAVFVPMNPHDGLDERLENLNVSKFRKWKEKLGYWKKFGRNYPGSYLPTIFFKYIPGLLIKKLLSGTSDDLPDPKYKQPEGPGFLEKLKKSVPDK